MVSRARHYGGFAPPARGQHFIVSSHCAYDDSLFYWKTDIDPSAIAGATNFLWDFSFYVPTTTKSSTVQAMEFDLFQAVQLSDGVHEFMFGSQCNHATNQWQFWLPRDNSLSWVDTGISLAVSQPGTWHHANLFLRRESDPNWIPGDPGRASVLPPTTTVPCDSEHSPSMAKPADLGGVAWSTIPNPPWWPVLGVQHQLDSAVSGAIDRGICNRRVSDLFVVHANLQSAQRPRGKSMHRRPQRGGLASDQGGGPRPERVEGACLRFASSNQRR